MKHARLIHSFNNRTLDFIEKWNSGYYNINGFDKAKEKINELILIHFLIENYNNIKDFQGIKTYINTSEINTSEIKLTYKHFNKISYLRRNYFKCICDICNKFNINYKEILKIFYSKYKREFNLFALDIASTPSFKNSFIK